MSACAYTRENENGCALVGNPVVESFWCPEPDSESDRGDL